jgi:hypothetical protein
MLRNNFNLAWRNLGRQKVFSIVNILGLSLGITCCLVISIFVRYELSFDHYHKKADQIYKVVQETKFAEGMAYWSTTAYPLADAIRNDFSNVSMVTQVAGPVPRMFASRTSQGMSSGLKKIMYSLSTHTIQKCLTSHGYKAMKEQLYQTHHQLCFPKACEQIFQKGNVHEGVQSSDGR